MSLNKDSTYSYSIDLGFTPSEVVACELNVSGDYISSSDTKSSENFRWAGGYSPDGKSFGYKYVNPFITTSQTLTIFSNDNMSNWSSFNTKCIVSGSKLSFRVYKGYDGTGTGLDLYTRAGTLYLSDTLVYK